MPRVLIVDDIEENRYVLKNFFRLFGLKAGIEVMEASSGKEAVERIKSEKPDLVFMDIKMETDLAGLDATKMIKTDSETRGIPIWAVTSQAMDAYDDEKSDRVKCLEAGCDDYITKPIDQVTLLKKVSKQLDLEIPAKTRMRMGG